jgi:two-component system, chemotaxis family, protein-glutamate methylesterase/glutaminase
MSGVDVVAVGSSAGGLKALTGLLDKLSPGFPAALLIVQHLDRRHPSLMAEILGRRTALEVRQAVEGDVVRPGVAFCAPSDRHLLVNPDGTLSLSMSELVHFLRPSADLLFESVAATYRSRAVGVILSGTGSDGTMGIRAIKKMGGTVIVQEPSSAEFRGMPDSAVHSGVADQVLPLAAIAPALERLAAGA